MWEVLIHLIWVEESEIDDDRLHIRTAAILREQSCCIDPDTVEQH